MKVCEVLLVEQCSGCVCVRTVCLKTGLAEMGGGLVPGGGRWRAVGPLKTPLLTKGVWGVAAAAAAGGG